MNNQAAYILRENTGTSGIVETARTVASTLAEHEIPHLIVGGLAVQEHGYPRVNPIVFDLIDEIADAFDADGFHVGMDEVFNLASDRCPRCRGQDPAKLFAKVVNEFYAHIAEERKMEMLHVGRPPA